MKWVSDKIILCSISFCFGLITCYLSLQFSYFQIKKELDVNSTILSIITLLTGVFIAITIQKSVTKNQNSHSFLTAKIDKQWNLFNEFSVNLLLNQSVDVSTIRSYSRNIVPPIGFLKDLFVTFNLDCNSVSQLETKLDELEGLLSNLPAINNNISIEPTVKRRIEAKILKINQCFGEVLKQIQEM